MDDRVGEILAQRARLGGGAVPGLLVSTFMHAAVSAAFVYAALHQPPVQSVRTVTIQLAPVERAAPPAAKPVAKPIAIPPVAPVVEKPIAPPVAKPEKNTAPPSPFGKSPKKASETAPPVKPAPSAPAAPATATAPDIPVGGTGVTALEGEPFNSPLYIVSLQRLVAAKWYPPTGSQGRTVVVRFVINSDGAIRDAAILTSSGDGTFDRAALRALLNSSPLPPLPFSYGGTWLGVQLTFR